MKKTLILLAFALQETNGQTITRGPYLQMATESSMTIRWRTSTSVTGRVTFGTDVNNLGNPMDESTSKTDHEVNLTGLSPDTLYYYSIGVPGVIMAGGDGSYSFKTSPSSGDSRPTRIWAIGDSGTGSTGQAAVRDSFKLFSVNQSPDLMLTLGDNAYNNGLDAEYQGVFFNIYPEILRKTPLWPALGNHDTAGATDPNVNYPYFQMFSLPTSAEAGGVAAGREHYYSFDRGNIHFICLDSMTMDRTSTGAMATWLQSDLAACTKTWIITYWHHPPYSKGSHDSDLAVEIPSAEIRANILPILESRGVDLVLTGHSHSYERSKLIDGHYGVSTTLSGAMIKNAGNGRESGNGAYVKPLSAGGHHGAVYIVAGSAGSLGGGLLNHPAMSQSLNQLGSVVIDINGTRMDTYFIQPTGTPLGSSYSIADSFTILKQANPDSDGDGIPDEYELLHGLNPNDPADALLDADNDGISNLDEYILETQPSPPRRVLTHSNSQTKVTQVAFYTLSGSQYRVFFSNDLITWNPGSQWIIGNNSSQAWTDDGSITPLGNKRFYRVTSSTSP